VHGSHAEFEEDFEMSDQIATNADEVAKSKIAVDVVRVMEIQKTIRYVVVCSLIAFLGWVIAHTIVKILDQPPWLTMTLVLITALAGPSGVIIVLIRHQRQYTLRNQGRVIDLEKKIDPKRSSSNVLEDGSERIL
jgi:hypothetical protein